ncbi:MAG: hypothetical protein ACTSRU_16965 [Candidatus Hodarchaeales archaeon]
MRSHQYSEFELGDILSDPEAKKKERERALLEAAQVVKNAFESDSGKKCLNLLSYKFFSQECFPDDNPDPYLAAKRDGQRSVMKFIYDMMGAAR